jgi:hypothetical protein
MWFGTILFSTTIQQRFEKLFILGIQAIRLSLLAVKISDERTKGFAQSTGPLKCHLSRQLV